MNPAIVALIIFAIVFTLILGGMWIFLALAITGLLGISLFTGYPVGNMIPQIAFTSNESFVLTCLPLFVLMGELLLTSGISKSLYSTLRLWVEWIPGRLLHSNILACTIFAAVSGSSAVTAATIGSIAAPELKELGYAAGPSVGTLAGAGTLGLLIPPSIVMIVYGAITGVSVERLFAAGIIPGLMLSALFMTYIIIYCHFRPEAAPGVKRKIRWGKKLIETLRILPTFLLISIVLGVIYAGIATPTEAGAVGALGAIVVAYGYGNLNWKVFRRAAFSTVNTTCMIMMIVTGASILSSCLAYLQIPQNMMNILVSLRLSKWFVFIIFCLIYIGLGCLFDGISMMLLTLPVIYPIVIGLGFNPVWFGVVLVILIETGQITPPVGFNLFILKNITGEDIGFIVRNSLPFFFLMLLGIIIITMFPGMVLWLPKVIM